MEKNKFFQRLLQESELKKGEILIRFIAVIVLLSFFTIIGLLQKVVLFPLLAGAVTLFSFFYGLNQERFEEKVKRMFNFKNRS